MTINVDKRDIGISIKIYVTKQELEQDSMHRITDDHKKDYRKQKTYKIMNFSEAKSKLLKSIIEHLYSQYSYYDEIIVNNPSYAKDAIKSKLFGNMSTKIDAYSHKIFDETFDVAYGFVFDTYIESEVYSLKDQYQLSPEKDILVTTIGTYGYGKTTLIKKVFGFDDFIFPLVDRGRTTINNCYLRGMLIKNGKIMGLDVESYQFKNQITLIPADEFYQNTLTIQLAKAYNKFCKLEDVIIQSNEADILKEFVTTDAANLDELFGDIDIFVNSHPEDSFYIKVLDAMHKIKAVQKENDSPIEIISTLGLKDDFSDFYKIIINKVLNDLKAPLYNKDIITFYLSIDEISEIDNYYFHFISNRSDCRGSLVRRLVKDIYLEIDLNTDEIMKSNILSENQIIDSILFADTMGAGHTTNKTSSKSSEYIDLSKHFSLLNESNIILLLDDAMQTMNPSTLEQIKLLDSYGLREKTILVYSKYNQFVKGNFKSDVERSQYLVDMLKEKLFEIFPLTENSKSEKAKILHNMFTDNNKQIVFLKGLVPYQYDNKKDENTNQRKKRQNNSTISTNDSLDDDSKARILNRNIENSTDSLIELFNKILDLNHYIKELDSKRCTISSNLTDSSLTLIFSQCFDSFSRNNLSNGYNEYISIPPEWNTSEALCYKLYCGETGFYGTSRTLFPLDDAINSYMLLFNDFIENSFILKIDSDDSLSEDFLKSKIKNIYTQHVKKLFYTYFILLNKPDWKHLYSQGGTGVKARRSNGIYSLIESTFSKNLNIKNSAYTLFVQSAQEVIDIYKS